MAVITQPGPTVRQVSGKDGAERPLLAVLVKRSYQIAFNERCVPLDKTAPLVEDPVFDPDAPGLLHDFELHFYKPATDVVIKGHAYALGSQRRFEASAQIGGARKALLVIGDRRCERSHTGKLLFSEPRPVEKVPLRYTHAFGGRDVAAEAKYGIPGAELLEYMDDPLDVGAASPFLYPRNPAGRGYVVEPSAEAVERVQLPNLEDPLDPLTPERLAVGNPYHWWTMPLPQATDWMDYDYFPRIAFAGIIPPCETPERPIAEVERGLTPANILSIDPTTDTTFGLASGASLGLRLPYLRGDEAVQLNNMHAQFPQLRFTLPGDRPKIFTDGRKGKLNATDPVLHSVVMEPDENRLTVVWCGAAPALRKYMPDELAKMPVRVEW